MNTGTRLDAGLLISGNDQFVLLEPAPLPDSLIQIEDATRLVGELRVPGEDPAAVLPGPNSVFIQPAPDGAIADGLNSTAAADAGAIEIDGVGDGGAAEGQLGAAGDGNGAGSRAAAVELENTAVDEGAAAVAAAAAEEDPGALLL